MDSSGSFRREGEYWTIVYDGKTIRLRDDTGLRYLAELLRQPGEDLHAEVLVGRVRLMPKLRRIGSRDRGRAAT